MAPQTRSLSRSLPADMPSVAELDAVPFYPQTPLHCGPAALATVLAASGVTVTPEALGAQVFLPAREGTLAVELVAAARRHGRVATRLPGRLDALLQEVAAGRPVVVLQNLGLALSPRWHYAVIVGFDLLAGEMVMRSGTVRRERMWLATFEHTWARGGHWALAVTAPGELPATAQEDAAVEAALAFERLAPAAQAQRHYEAVLARWPDQRTAGLGLGNTRFAAGDLPGAASAFESVARRHDAAAAWNNLALVRWQLGQADAAREALAQAQRRVREAETSLASAVRDTAAKLGQRP